MAALLSDQPDIVLCDINMSIMSDFEVLERLTALAPRFADMPFIFFTAFDDRDNELGGRRLSTDHYVTKPIDFEILSTIINARLARIRGKETRLAVDLTDREIDALTWSARGKTSDEIAQVLGLTKGAVDSHLKYACAKLGAATCTRGVSTAVTGN